ncbi:MAG: hypothetical protein WBN95_07700 [Gammaproteobacteria bacterium]
MKHWNGPVGAPSPARIAARRRSYNNIFAGMRLQILLLVGLTSGLVHAVEYQAFAPVLKVEPITETRYEAVSHEVCTEPDDSAREFNNVAASLGEDIRHQTHLWQQQHSCRSVTEQRARETVVGYRVTYRYGGETATTRLSYDPGERMPVNVSLSPLK